MRVRKSYRKFIALRVFRRPELIPFRRQREITFRAPFGQHPLSILYFIPDLSPLYTFYMFCTAFQTIQTANMHRERLEVLRRGHIHIADPALQKAKFKLPVHTTRRAEGRARGESAHVVASAW